MSTYISQVNKIDWKIYFIHKWGKTRLLTQHIRTFYTKKYCWDIQGMCSSWFLTFSSPWSVYCHRGYNSMNKKWFGNPLFTPKIFIIIKCLFFISESLLFFSLRSKELKISFNNYNTVNILSNSFPTDYGRFGWIFYYLSLFVKNKVKFLLRYSVSVLT